jgi:DNA mismatch repair ATPase MutS
MAWCFIYEVLQKLNFRADADELADVILFRMGDFYETFLDDAKIAAAKILGLVLTSRDRGPDGMPMAGFPPEFML